MASFESSIDLKMPQAGHGGGSAPPLVGGGDNDNHGDGGLPDYNGRLRRARLGIAVALPTFIMVFIAMTSALVVRRGLPTFDDRTATYVRDWLQVTLPLPLLLINTLILLLSTVTMELARRQITRQAALAPVRTIPGVSLGEERHFPWMGATVVLGLGFLVGQWLAWNELSDSGFRISTSPSSSFFYLLTGMHALHLVGGVVALLYAGATSLLQRPVEARRIVVDVTAWYWHFVALLWLYIFALLWFVR